MYTGHLIKLKGFPKSLMSPYLNISCIYDYMSDLIQQFIMHNSSNITIFSLITPVVEIYSPVIVIRNRK